MHGWLADWHTTIENTRGAVVTELSELRAFFHLRSSELGSATYAAILPSTPEAVQQTDSKAIQDMLSVVTDCMDTYTSDKLKTLIALAHSKRYFGRTVAGLQRQASQQSKFYR